MVVWQQHKKLFNYYLDLVALSHFTTFIDYENVFNNNIIIIEKKYDPFIVIKYKTCRSIKIIIVTKIRCLYLENEMP